MRAKGIGAYALYQIVRAVSECHYDGNITFLREPETRGNWVHFTLTVQDSAGEGGRRGHSGRRIKAACWHAHRDVLMTLFDQCPDAIVVTAKARYEGREGFLQVYPPTGEVNIGSRFAPLAYRDACDCVGRGDPPIEVDPWYDGEQPPLHVPVAAASTDMMEV